MKRSRIIRKDEKGVSPVIATILMVAITVVLAAVLYVMVTGLLAGPGASLPKVTTANLNPVVNGFSFEVAAASQAKPLLNYKVNFGVGTLLSVPVALTTASMTFVVPAGTTYTVTYGDIGGEGSVTGGDRFQATKTTPAGALTAGTVYHVFLLWSDGTQIFDADFTAT